MAKQYAFIDYTFILDTNTWQHVSQFESDLADFFSAYNLECQRMNSIGGQVGKRVFILRPIAVLGSPKGPSQTKPVSTKTMFKNVAKNFGKK
jgi:hypothetical protein